MPQVMAFHLSAANQLDQWGVRCYYIYIIEERLELGGSLKLKATSCGRKVVHDNKISMG